MVLVGLNAVDLALFIRSYPPFQRLNAFSLSAVIVRPVRVAFFRFHSRIAGRYVNLSP